MTDAPQDSTSTGTGSGAAASAAAGRRLRDDFAPRSGQGIAGQVVQRRRGFVRFMKFVLPVGAVALVGLIAAWPQLTKRDTGFRLAFSSIETQEMALVMNNPRFRGNDSNGQPYIVTADRAMQDPNDSKLVTLDKISADITLNDGAWISLTSNTGVYNNTARMLTLHGDINVYSDRGYEFHGINAEIDLNTGVLASDDKVWGHASLGSIRANGMRVYDRGKTIVFINGVKTTLNPRGAG
ncbi:LPS export ABC transporter periplasmic protein LptC [Ferrovibrio sp.]|uniref:LPS export ABC transporter periplasmic protein LptC n=1 Tax=Ferrovibrio sp. TaxID=1917215 RepID=UPI003D0F66A5